MFFKHKSITLLILIIKNTYSALHNEMVFSAFQLEDDEAAKLTEIHAEIDTSSILLNIYGIV